jgi:hypothetical protein
MKKLTIDCSQFQTELEFYDYLTNRIKQDSPRNYPQWRIDLFCSITEELFEEDEPYEPIIIEFSNYNKSIHTYIDEVKMDFLNHACCKIDKFMIWENDPMSLKAAFDKLSPYDFLGNLALDSENDVITFKITVADIIQIYYEDCEFYVRHYFPSIKVDTHSHYNEDDFSKLVADLQVEMGGKFDWLYNPYKIKWWYSRKTKGNISDFKIALERLKEHR